MLFFLGFPRVARASQERVGSSAVSFFSETCTCFVPKNETSAGFRKKRMPLQPLKQIPKLNKIYKKNNIAIKKIGVNF